MRCESIADVSPILRCLNSDNKHERLRVLDLLRHLNPPQLADSIAPLLNDRESGIRLHAAAVLSSLGDARGLEALRSYSEE
jgi:HEAT repeat protein